MEYECVLLASVQSVFLFLFFSPSLFPFLFLFIYMKVCSYGGFTPKEASVFNMEH